MAVNNSLTKKEQRLGLTAYLTQDAVKNQINNVIGGKDGQRFISSRSGFKCWICHLLRDPGQLIFSFPNIASHLLQS